MLVLKTTMTAADVEQKVKIPTRHFFCARVITNYLKSLDVVSYSLKYPNTSRTLIENTTSHSQYCQIIHISKFARFWTYFRALLF